MLRRRISGVPLLLVFIPLLPVHGESGNATCPYDLDGAARMIPQACFANATGIAASSTTSCCWYVFAAYIYAASLHANATGAAFLPQVTADACSSTFSSDLLRRGLVSPSLFLPASSSKCNLAGDPVPFAAGKRPCQFSTISAVRSAVDLSNATAACSSTSAPRDLAADQSACVACQNTVIAATFDLFNVTGSKEFVPCGMAATIAIWSAYPPRVARFRSYALCMLQVLENVGNLGTGDLIPSPPPPPNPQQSPSPPSSQKSSRSVKIVAGSVAAAGAVSITAILFLAFAIYRRRRSNSITTNDEADTPGGASSSAIGSPLPTEGLYIFTRSELKQATKGFDDRLLLGEGGAGKVYLGKLPSGQHVAIKRIYREKKVNEFYKEVEILAKLRHRSLTTLVGYCVGKRGREVALVYEYLAGGNLAGALHKSGGSTEFGWAARVRIAVDVAEGLAYLHSLPEGSVVHRDVKPTNVLLTEGWAHGKLSDFGVSRVVPPGGGHLSTEVRGTMGYVDPESVSAGQVSEAADVYSFGVVLLELVTGKRAVVQTPSGGAESIVHTARVAVATSDGGLESIVDARLGEGWDRGTVATVFQVACRCVRPYKSERPEIAEVLAVLHAALSELERTVAYTGSSPASLISETVISVGASAPGDSQASTTPAQPWSW